MVSALQSEIAAQASCFCMARVTVFEGKSFTSLCLSILAGGAAGLLWTRSAQESALGDNWVVSATGQLRDFSWYNSIDRDKETQYR